MTGDILGMPVLADARVPEGYIVLLLRDNVFITAFVRGGVPFWLHKHHTRSAAHEDFKARVRKGF